MARESSLLTPHDPVVKGFARCDPRRFVDAAMRGTRSRAIRWLYQLGVECCNEADYRNAALACKLMFFLDRRCRAAALVMTRIYEETFDLKNGIAFLTHWLGGSPDDLEAHLAASQLHLLSCDTPGARRHLEAAERIDPGSTKALVMFAHLCRFDNDLEGSQRFVRRILEQDEGNYHALVIMAQNLIDLGEKTEAIRILEVATRSSSCPMKAYTVLAGIRHYKSLDHPHLVHIRSLLEMPDLPAVVRKDAHFMLGTVCDALGLWDDAFAHFRAGNEWARSAYDFEEERRLIDSTTQFFDRDFIGQFDDAGDDGLGGELIFVIGMPRSGTTLVEQVLASHPDVHAGGERFDIHRIMEDLSATLDAGEGYPGCLRRLDRESARRAAAAHLDYVKGLKSGKRFFVDKLPSNYKNVGLIRLLFPAAKVVVCRRDALDVCLSCYFHNFSAVPFSNDLATTAEVYREHERLIGHWHSVLKRPMIEVQYEAMVRDTGVQIRRLLAYCGLPWAQECEHFYDTRRAVSTASSSQVKSPIYSTSIGRWKHYRKHISPLIEWLGGDLAPEGPDGQDPGAGHAPGARP